VTASAFSPSPIMRTFGFEPGMIDYRTVVVTVIFLGCVLIALWQWRSDRGYTARPETLPFERPTIADVATTGDDYAPCGVRGPPSVTLAD
jgi:hypothetical protein